MNNICGARHAERIETLTYSFTNAWGAGWTAYSRVWFMLAIGVSICALVSLPPVAGAQVFQAVAASGPLKERAPEAAVALQKIGGLFGCCAFVYSIFVATPMTFGLLAFAIGATREGSVRFALLLEGYRRFPRVLGTTLLLAVVAWVPLLLGLAVAWAITAF